MNRRTHPPRAIACAIALAVCAVIAAPGCGDATDHRPAAWEYISPAIIQPNCATTSCHGQAAAVSGLDFSTPDRGYASLTALWVWIVDPNGTIDNGCQQRGDQIVCQRNHRPLVTPFDPAQSRLTHMLRADGAPRMPPDRPLPEADIALIERWILNGARRHLEDTGRDAAVPLDGGGDRAGDGAGDGAGEGGGSDGGASGDAGSDGGAGTGEAG